MHFDGNPNPRQARAVRRAADAARAAGDLDKAARRVRLAKELEAGFEWPELAGGQLRRRRVEALRSVPVRLLPGVAGRDPWLEPAA